MKGEGFAMDLRRSARGEQTRAGILQAAYDLFIEQGYHGTSMRQIAKSAHIALGGLYNHFTSKNDVFKAVFLAYHPYHQVFPLIMTAKGANLEELLRDAFGIMVQAVGDRPDFMNLMFIEMVEFKSIHARELFATLLPQGLQILQRLAESFPEQIRPLPSPMVVRTILGLFLGYYLTEVAFATGAPPEFRQNAMQSFIDIYLHGIIVSPPSKQS